MTGYRITGYLPRYRPAIAALQQMLWKGGLHGNGAYLDWKYRRNPYLDDRYLTLAWVGGELVGMVGAFGAHWEMGDRTRVMLPCLADTIVVPEHRGGPLFGRMLDDLGQRLCRDGVPWLLDFGDQPAGPMMLIQGWTAIGPWPVASAPLAPDAARPWPVADRAGRRSGAAIRCGEPRDLAAVAALATGLPRSGGIRHVRDLAYLRWRDQNPLARYFHLGAWSSTRDGAELVGYLVAHRANAGGDDPTTVVECESMHEDVWTDLLDAALSVLPGPVLTMWARDLGPDRVAALASIGFQRREPTGRVTRDQDLPNLLIRRTSPATGDAALARLGEPDLWDLRAVCGRSWR